MPRTLQIGQKVDAYEVVAELGAGGMAELFLGVDAQRRPVAIKAIRPEHNLDKAFIEMFRDEANIASKIDHPNVVKLIETGSSEGNHFLVMEYLHGVTLSSLLRRLYEMGRTLNPLAASAIAIRMGRGLHAAHELRGSDGASLNVIHRDVSPQNMMLLNDGQVKLIDFLIVL
jgi:serine/threonine protein kinase